MKKTLTSRSYLQIKVSVQSCGTQMAWFLKRQWARAIAWRIDIAFLTPVREGCSSRGVVHAMLAWFRSIFTMRSCKAISQSIMVWLLVSAGDVLKNAANI
jgi:hypothetical protein